MQGERLAALQQVFSGFMEEVISGMAGYIPLKAIGDRILAQYSRQQWGDFRGTLLGLLSAYSYESSILTTARSLAAAQAGLWSRTMGAIYTCRCCCDSTRLCSMHARNPLGAWSQSQLGTRLHFLECCVGLDNRFYLWFIFVAGAVVSDTAILERLS